MMIETERIWLEEQQSSIEAREEWDRLGIGKSEPEPVYNVFVEEIWIDLALVQDITTQTIILGDTKYLLPQLEMSGGTIHTINEDPSEIRDLVLKAKKLESFVKGNLRGVVPTTAS